MASTDARIDAYIAKSAEFARPILTHLRELVHKACPAVTETVKWGMPFFEYDGSILANMAAFKQHCSFGFWNASQMKDAGSKLQVKDRGAMGNFDRLTALGDLPADKAMLAYIKEAATLIEKGVKKPVAKKAPKADLPVPPALAAALKKNKKAQAAFEGFSPSHRREYIEWITEARTDATRDKRIATTVEWLMEGKSRMWKYRK
ncbi:MAG TPA: YdeI/OmpD-associated family protein [Puia sp.]|nr:YdeI/OmpD-associated family protein [Puia sp.]